MVKKKIILRKKWVGKIRNFDIHFLLSVKIVVHNFFIFFSFKRKHEQLTSCLSGLRTFWMMDRVESWIDLAARRAVAVKCTRSFTISAIHSFNVFFPETIESYEEVVTHRCTRNSMGREFFLFTRVYPISHTTILRCNYFSKLAFFKCWILISIFIALWYCLSHSKLKISSDNL